MALQRFGIFNMFQGLNGVLQWGGSVALLAWGFGLEEIVLLTVASRVVLVLVAFAILPQFIPNLFASIPLWDRVTLRKLISFGGWVTVSQLISPLFMYVDRVFIGMFLSLAAVAYYTVPQEALTRVLIVPMSLTTTLFPAMSGQPIALDQANKTAILYYRSLKYLTIIMVPLVLSFLLFSSEILRLWLGDEFAAQSVTVFQILALGILVNSLSQVPTTALHAFGRPDITAKFHIIELPLMVVLNLILIPSIGIAGAAIAWTLRVWIDGLLLFLAAQRRISETYRDVGRMWTSRYAAIQPLALLVLAAAVLLLTDGSTRIAVAIVGGVLYVVATWLYSFDEVDRNFFLQLRSRIFG
jgi:O-antigen/teichoic acid export membrane protein